MGDPLQPVKPGDRLRIPAPAWNAFCEAARAERARVRRGGRPGGPAAPGPGLLVPIQNASGGDCGRYAVLGIDDVLVAPDNDEDLEKFLAGPVYSCITPADPDHVGRFVILLDAVKDGEVGWACAGGLSAVQVDVTDVDHLFADVADGDSEHLASGETGAAEILWREDEEATGVMWAVVRFGGRAGEPLPDGTEDYQVLVWDDTAGDWAAGWPRMHG